MTTASDYVAENARELARMRRFVEGLSEDDLGRQVNDSWTVAGVLGHIAFWDGRALALADKLVRGVPFSASDDEPEDVDWINDASRPLILAIPPAETAALALRISDETDRRMASLPAELIARSWPADPSSPLNTLRAGHRAEHLDEVEASLQG